jgi:ABC-type branched-subunit amino acid transport system ATPase component
LVILDEPVASVNPVMADVVAGALGEFPGLGITALVVEHNLAFVAETCATVIVMAAGRVIATGALDDLQKDQTVVEAYLGDLSGHIA